MKGQKMSSIGSPTNGSSSLSVVPASLDPTSALPTNASSTCDSLATAHGTSERSYTVGDHYSDDKPKQLAERALGVALASEARESNLQSNTTFPSPVSLTLGEILFFLGPMAPL